MSLGETAILFPGQGVGDRSSRDLVAAARPDLLRLAEALTGADPFDRIEESTRFAQPAIYCASLASFESLGRPAPACFAGHSIGEIGALAAAGAIDDRDALHLVIARGEAMEEAARSQPPGGMLAVRADRDEALALARGQGLVLANENAPRQYVLSGPQAGIEAAAALARADGIRTKRLPVAGAFHTAEMVDAVPPFRKALDAVEIGEPAAPVISCSTGEPFAGEIGAALAAAVALPVRWVDVLQKVQAMGVRRYLDAGPGRVLAGLVAHTIEGAEVEAAWEGAVHV
jgi:malonyl CoA-acyl carrier protein transacylase